MVVLHDDTIKQSMILLIQGYNLFRCQDGFMPQEYESQYHGKVINGIGNSSFEEWTFDNLGGFVVGSFKRIKELKWK